MKKLLIAAALTVGAYVFAQTCIVPRPAAPPKATEGTIVFTNIDGGSRPCFIRALVPGGHAPNLYPVQQGARCDTAKQMADQAAAIDNGWDDGGQP